MKGVDFTVGRMVAVLVLLLFFLLVDGYAPSGEGSNFEAVSLISLFHTDPIYCNYASYGSNILVLDIIRRDAQKDPAVFPDALQAKTLINQGVTYVGARDQIMRRLKDRGAISDNQKLFVAACYAANVRGKELFVFAVINLVIIMCTWIRLRFFNAILESKSHICVLACISSTACDVTNNYLTALSKLYYDPTEVI
ncbi:hypothetical protein K1719_035189 [Acacia pycnantha]|nr:hypothetical protein K1719_035189 [Acacia pycnantha]